jgi:hypothetical protein
VKSKSQKSIPYNYILHYTTTSKIKQNIVKLAYICSKKSPIKLNMCLPCDSAMALLGIYPRESTSVFTPNSYMNVLSSFICNSQKQKTNQMLQIGK